VVQVLSNLLGNAEKFTSRGGTVVVSLRREGNQALLRVRDSGAGIEPEVLSQIFEPFTQAPQTLERTRGGLGLGLAMVKGLVELHGGTVSAASDGAGRGAEFTIALPIETNPMPPAPPRRSAETQRRRVLLIEDNHDAASSLSEALVLSGHEVRVADNGAKGLEIAREDPPEVVICDIGLPGMDGCSVARAFHREEALRGAHLVALTGYAQPEDVQRATEAGFERLLAKPATMEQIALVFDELSGGGRLV
jgi:CheY-like chemotaxis protein